MSEIMPPHCPWCGNPSCCGLLCPAKRSEKDNLILKIKSHEAHVVVVGIGYVGLPLVVELAKSGFQVTGFDYDYRKVDQINRGESYIEDVRKSDLEPYVKMGRIRATVEESIIGTADCVILCVPTPLKKSRDPDISYIQSAVESVVRNQRNNMLVVLESTSYPGTTRDCLVEELTKNRILGEDIFIAFSPERVDPGNPKYGTRNTPKVLGGATQNCLEVAQALYSQVVDTVVPVSSTGAAEMTKLLENTFRAVNIGLVNEFALLCERLGLDVWEIIRAASTKPYGYMPFYPGPGLGGHCIPIDPLYLSWKMKSLHMSARFIELADSVNSEMPQHVVSLVQDALNTIEKPLKGSKLLILGVAYKKDIRDVRESPAIEVIQKLQAKGANVDYLDPWVPSFHEGGIQMESRKPDLDYSGYDCVIIITNHTCFDYLKILRDAKLIVDARNATGVPSSKIFRLGVGRKDSM